MSPSTKWDDDPYLRTKGDSRACKVPPGCPVKATIFLLNQRWELALPKVPSPGLLSDCTPSSHLARLASPPWLCLRRGLRQAPEEPRAGLCRSRLPPSLRLPLIKQVPRCSEPASIRGARRGVLLAAPVPGLMEWPWPEVSLSEGSPGGSACACVCLLRKSCVCASL